MDRLEEAMGELGAAVMAQCANDDEILMEHVRRAHELVRAEWRELQANRAANADVASTVRVHADANRMLMKALGLKGDL